MNGTRARAIAILFLVVLLLLFLLVPREGLAEEPAFQMSFGWALRLIGGAIAVIGAVEILFLAIQRNRQDLPLTVAVLLAGLSLSSPAWPIVLGLAAMAITFAVLPLWQDRETQTGGSRRKTATSKKK